MPLNGSSPGTLWILPPDRRAMWHRFAMGIAVQIMLCLLFAASVSLFQTPLHRNHPPKPADKKQHVVLLYSGPAGSAAPLERTPLLSLKEENHPVPPKPVKVGEGDSVHNVDFELELAPDERNQLTRVLSLRAESGVACYDRNNPRFFTSFYNRNQDDSGWIPQVPPEKPDATQYYVRDLTDPVWRPVVGDLCGDEMGVSVAFTSETVATWKYEISEAMDWQNHPDEKLLRVRIEFDTNAGNMLFKVKDTHWEKNAPK